LFKPLNVNYCLFNQNFVSVTEQEVTKWQYQLCGVNSFTSNVCGIYKLHITSHKTGTKRWPKVVVLIS